MQDQLHNMPSQSQRIRSGYDQEYPGEIISLALVRETDGFCYWIKDTCSTLTNRLEPV